MSTTPQIIGYFITGLNCILLMAGFAAGIIAITRRKTGLGILAAVGFALLGLNLIVSLALPSILGALSSIDALKATQLFVLHQWLNICLQAPLFLLGMASLIIFVFSGVGIIHLEKKQKKETSDIADIQPM